jgi:hypothetical protein
LPRLRCVCRHGSYFVRSPGGGAGWVITVLVVEAGYHQDKTPALCATAT